MIIKSSGRVLHALSATTLGVVLLAACQTPGPQDDARDVRKAGPHASSSSVAPTAPAHAARITISPFDTVTDPVATDRTVKVQAAHGTLTSVEVRPDGGEGVTVTGTWGEGKRTWQSDRTMTPGTRYVVEAVAANAAGATTRTRKEFRTRAAARVNGVTVTPSRGAVVGVGQPVSLAFDTPVKDKAAVERRLSITTEPKVEGSWGWTRDPLTGVERVDWRPRDYWAKGTKVTMRARLSGVHTGDGRYLRRDVSTAFTTGTARISEVDLTRHTMTVTEDGKKIRDIPISGGKPAYPTWNGTMVVLGKKPMVRMTSQSVGITAEGEQYDKQVPWTVHMTTSGTYAHAAPWNEGKGYFGKVNMSHGCVGMTEADGKWFYDRSVPGDLITVKGSTRATVATGNGFGDWNLTFDEWRKLSALS
ncbi:L,D-transpeptidase [Streptomyces sp. O3]